MSQYPLVVLAFVATLSAGAAQAQTTPAPADQPTTANPSDPKLAVASLKLENGYRASKIIGSTVYNEQNQAIGDVADLFMSKQNQVAMVVISVGSFLGIGGKQVALPIDKLQIDDKNKVVMPGGTKDALTNMPTVDLGS